MAVPASVYEYYARYYGANKAGNVFYAHTGNAAITWTVGLTTTTIVGLVLSNPVGSNKNIILLQAEFCASGVIVGGVGISVMPYTIGATTHSTALTIRNAIGGAAMGTGVGIVGSCAYADSGVVLPAAPVAARMLWSAVSTNTAVSPPPVLIDLGGSLILSPGTAGGILATQAVTGWASLCWQEEAV